MITDWQPDLPENTFTLPPHLKNLMQTPSLTIALSQYTALFDVELRYVGFLTAEQQQANTNTKANLALFIREVYLRLNQIPVV